MRAKAKKAPVCSVSLLAIELKGLAAPGEALKIISDASSIGKHQDACVQGRSLHARHLQVARPGIVCSFTSR